MASALVLINGLPGAGKTTLATELAAPLDATSLSKDEVKQALAGLLRDPTAVPALGAIAMDSVWALAAATPGTVVVESWWFRPRDLGLAETGLRRVGARRAVEVWCDVPADLARTRYAARIRPLWYDDARRLAENWADWAARGEPLVLTPVLRVDTSRAVDAAHLADAIRTEFRRQDAAP